MKKSYYEKELLLELSGDISDFCVAMVFLFLLLLWPN